MRVTSGAEFERLQHHADWALPVSQGSDWDRWGPYLSERAWGTVREDYSDNGDAWAFFPHEQARSRAYRWNEDGLAGLSDVDQYLCLALALWNGKDPHLKERIFGLAGPQGNHGEDAKEYWWYLDATPSHSYLHWRYHYPHAEFPYEDLVETNASRGKDEREYELIDTGVFAEDRFWIVDVVYAKSGPSDIVMRVSVTNAGPETESLHVVPTLWFRDVWTSGEVSKKPVLDLEADAIRATHEKLPAYRLLADPGPDGTQPKALFCNNATNKPRVFGDHVEADEPFPKDGIDDFIVSGAETVNPDRTGTKAAWWYTAEVPPGETVNFTLRLTDGHAEIDPDDVIADRRREADEFHEQLTSEEMSAQEKSVLRQAFAGMIWGKQFYAYDATRWFDGDPGAKMPPPPEHQRVRNQDWRHLNSRDIISMPDPWEYPWFAAWDLAFHTVVLAHVDPRFAKNQLHLFLREWFQHPNGAIPAYEWNFDDVNPPVHAWAVLRVFEIDGAKDYDFLEVCFHKLLLNFTWWVNRQDVDGNSAFGGGFLGLDNIGPVDRSRLPGGYKLEQSDGTAWMAFYCIQMLSIVNHLVHHDHAYRALLLTFLQRFASIVGAIETSGLWDHDDGFFYDQLVAPDGSRQALKVTSLVGVIPIVACATVELAASDSALARVRTRRAYHELLARSEKAISTFVDSEHLDVSPDFQRVALTLADPERLRQVLAEVLSEDSMLSPYGVRSLSKRHLASPFVLDAGGQTWGIGYEPGESTTGMYGGNSNWRGPVWLPINYLLLEGLGHHHRNLGNGFTVEFPTGSGVQMTLAEVEAQIRERIVNLFLSGADGVRPSAGRPDERTALQTDPRWHDSVLFYEYFDGENGAGLGASHQTGWTGLVADLIMRKHGLGV